MLSLRPDVDRLPLALFTRDLDDLPEDVEASRGASDVSGAVRAHPAARDVPFQDADRRVVEVIDRGRIR